MAAKRLLTASSSFCSQTHTHTNKHAHAHTDTHTQTPRQAHTPDPSAPKEGQEARGGAVGMGRGDLQSETDLLHIFSCFGNINRCHVSMPKSPFELNCQTGRPRERMAVGQTHTQTEGRDRQRQAERGRQTDWYRGRCFSNEGGSKSACQCGGQGPPLIVQ